MEIGDSLSLMLNVELAAPAASAKSVPSVPRGPVGLGASGDGVASPGLGSRVGAPPGGATVVLRGLVELDAGFKNCRNMRKDLIMYRQNFGLFCRVEGYYIGSVKQRCH